MKEMSLDNHWEVAGRLGSGGFGEVFRVVSSSQERALKLVPKASGGESELLLMDLGTAKNIVPVLEVGETDEAWALLMPLAALFKVPSESAKNQIQIPLASTAAD